MWHCISTPSNGRKIGISLPQPRNRVGGRTSGPRVPICRIRLRPQVRVPDFVMRRNLSRTTSAALCSLIRRSLHVAQAALPQNWVFRYYRFPWWVNSTHDSLVESLREGINRRPSLDHTLGTPISPSLCDHRRHRAGLDCDIQCSPSLYHWNKESSHPEAVCGASTYPLTVATFHATARLASTRKFWCVSMLEFPPDNVTMGSLTLGAPVLPIVHALGSVNWVPV